MRYLLAEKSIPPGEKNTKAFCSLSGTMNNLACLVRAPALLQTLILLTIKTCL